MMSFRERELWANIEELCDGHDARSDVEVEVVER